MARLLSVNVGLPCDIEWRGKTVRTGIWKDEVRGRRHVGRLNIEGDGQGDLAGHGGEQRAVLVYQIESYLYWQDQLGRDDFTHGQFGENFTVEGLPDDEVCIGDRYSIGGALFEVTQPRVTCYRVGIRLGEPRMASLLTSSGRPGFYLRVIEEGDVAAGDPILLVGRPPGSMTVAVVNSLLYSSSHPVDLLERALTSSALSPGWRQSFQELRQAHDAHSSSGTGAVPAVVAVAPSAGFRGLKVVQLDRESVDVISFVLQPTDGKALTIPLAGQFIVLRMRLRGDNNVIFRSYSLSGPPGDRKYRISVKIEAHGIAGGYLSSSIRVNDVLEVSEPRGGFALRPGDGPVVLLSAGIGATPVLAMLHALAVSATQRQVWWLHSARNGASHSFAGEVKQILGGLARQQSRIWYSQPAADDLQGRNYDVVGRMKTAQFEELGVPLNGDFYVCGPLTFLAYMQEGLRVLGVSAQGIHSEIFGGGPTLSPGVVAAVLRAPHQPVDAATTGSLVSFARSGITTHWRPSEQSLLELAEACDVPVRWSCRSGVCHNCESGLVSGAVAYDLEPLEAPAEGSVLICCSRPLGDVVLDL